MAVRAAAVRHIRNAVFAEAREPAHPATATEAHGRVPDILLVPEQEAGSTVLHAKAPKNASIATEQGDNEEGNNTK